MDELRILRRQPCLLVPRIRAEARMLVHGTIPPSTPRESLGRRQVRVESNGLDPRTALLVHLPMTWLFAPTRYAVVSCAGGARWRAVSNTRGGEACAVPAHGALEHEVEHEGIVVLNLLEHRHRVRGQKAELHHVVEVEQRRDAGKRIVGAVQKPVVPFGAPEHLSERRRRCGSTASVPRCRP